MHPPAIAVTIRTTGYQKTIFPIVKNRKSTRLISILLLSPIDADGKIAINQLAFPETEYSSVGMNTTISDSTIAVWSCTETLTLDFVSRVPIADQATRLPKRRITIARITQTLGLVTRR